MSKLPNNLKLDCNLTHENSNPEAKVEKTTVPDFDATRMSISSDMENGVELDSDVTRFNNTSITSSNVTGSNNSSMTNSNTTGSINTSVTGSNASGSSNTSVTGSNVSGSSNTSVTSSNASGSSLKGTPNEKRVTSIRTDKKNIDEIRGLLNPLFINSLADSLIIQLAVAYVCEYYRINKTDESKREEINKVIDEASNLQDKKNDLVSFRISSELKDEIKKVYRSKTVTFAINCCLIEFRNHILASETLSQCSTMQFSYTSSPLERNEYLFARLGLKNNNLLDMITETIEEIQNSNNCDKYYEPFTGTANVLLHLTTKFTTEEINDGDEDIINLLSVIQKWGDEFIFKLLQYPVKKETFDELKVENKNNDKGCKNKSSRSKKLKLNNAVIFFYTILLSYYGKGDSLKEKVTDETLLKKLIVLFKMHQRLADVKITKNNAFYFLKKISKLDIEVLKKTIINFDPPYIATEQYYPVSQKNLKKTVLKASFHRKLNKKILALKDKGANIVISYRATVTSNNKYGMTNENVQEILDELYKGKGFFIQFEKVKNEQIEIVLTNVQVSGSYSYNISIADLIKKYVK